MRGPFAPPKDEPPLLIDANAVSAFEIALERFKAISRWRSEVAKPRCRIEKV